MRYSEDCTNNDQNVVMNRFYFDDDIDATNCSQYLIQQYWLNLIGFFTNVLMIENYFGVETNQEAAYRARRKNPLSRGSYSEEGPYSTDH